MNDRVVLATYAALPLLDPDDRLLAQALRSRGARVAAAVWDDPGADWRATACVLRSTWDYPRKVAAFSRWIDAVAATTTLWNPAHVVRWNMHKFYLRELERRGVPIVPTAWVGRGDDVDLGALMRGRGWAEAVVKPSHGAGTAGVRRSGTTRASIARAQAHARALAAEQDVLVQRYMPSVDVQRERALVFIDGAFSHAVAKTAFQALLPAGEAGESPADATAAEIDVARAALDAAPGPLLYARVDLVADERSLPVLMELELIEPSLFFAMRPAAAERLADALLRRIGGPPGPNRHGHRRPASKGAGT